MWQTGVTDDIASKVETSEEGIGMSGSTALAPLRDPRFAWFFTGRLISTAGSVMAPIALTFVVLEISDSPMVLGQVLAARSAPLVLLLLVGGVVADRMSRSAVLLISHLASAATQGTVAVLVLTGRADIPTLIVLEVLNGTMTAFTIPAIQGMVPQVVDRRFMQEANALLAFSRSSLAVLGPAIAGSLAVTVGAGWALAFDALTWLVAAVCMAFVRVPSSADGRSGGLGRDLTSGWHLFRSTTWLWVVVLACGFLNAIHAGAWSTLGPAMATADPGIRESGWGLAVSAEAVGLLVFTLVMMRVQVMHPLRIGMLSMIGLTFPLFALALGAPLPVLLLGAFFAGAGMQVFMISWQTAIHENVPERYLSRVSAYDALGSFVAIPLGQLAIGPLAAATGNSAALVASGALFLVVIVTTLGVGSVRSLRRPDRPGSEPSSADERAESGAGRVEGADTGR